MKLNPKTKYNVQRIIPFGFIWLITGWIFLVTESLSTGAVNPNPETAITLTPLVFVFASIAVTVMGLLMGAFELVILEKKFKDYSFLEKVSYKFLIYIGLLIFIIGLNFPIATSIELGKPISDPLVWEKTGRFIGSLTFYNTVIQLSSHILLSLLYAAISENLGHRLLANLFFGKYHTPKQESRIFMFLDMKDSTQIAESLGHLKCFEFLQEYYDVMTDSIINNYGEVYQYVGDEVIITWKEKAGIRNNKCISCYFDIKKAIARQENEFIKKFGVYPVFKAGLHIGEVTIGEIGALKKEIVYTGDVLNATSRIQSLCNDYQASLLISETLHTKLEQDIQTEQAEVTLLRGKTQTLKILKVE